jgi:hypothetical protein
VQSDAFYDVVGSVTTILTILTCFKHLQSNLACQLKAEAWPDSCYVVYVAMMLVLFWTLRLGAFLGYRIFRMGHDSRFNKIKKSPAAFLVAWTAQGVWVFCITVPVTVLSSEVASGGSAPVNRVLAVVGVSLWLLGTTIEIVADWQKLSFRLDPANKVGHQHHRQLLCKLSRCIHGRLSCRASLWILASSNMPGTQATLEKSFCGPALQASALHLFRPGAASP